MIGRMGHSSTSNHPLMTFFGLANLILKTQRPLYPFHCLTSSATRISKQVENHKKKGKSHIVLYRLSSSRILTPIRPKNKESYGV